MTDNEIKKYAKTYNPCDDCQHSFSKNSQESNVCKICEFKQDLDLINRLEEENANYSRNNRSLTEAVTEMQKALKKQSAENERLTEILNATIAGQETLQKALAEKNAEIERLKAERNQYIEDQPYVWANVARELAERIKLKFWNKSRCYLAKDIIEIVDNVLVEMVGDAE